MHPMEDGAVEARPLPIGRRHLRDEVICKRVLGDGNSAEIAPFGEI
jgi:hypothetical protein